MSERNEIVSLTPQNPQLKIHFSDEIKTSDSALEKNAERIKPASHNIHNTISMVCVVNAVEIYPDLAAAKMMLKRYRPIQPQPSYDAAAKALFNQIAQKSLMDVNKNVLNKSNLGNTDDLPLLMDDHKETLLENHSEVRESFQVEKLQVAGYYCSICNCFYQSVAHCPAHTEPQTIVVDSAIPSRARMTIPKELSLQPSHILAGVNGIWAQNFIENKTQFGPLVGKLILKEDVEGIDISDKPHLWQVYQDGSLIHGLDTTDENQCNWMMFVQRARSCDEQNLVAFLLDSKIYFMSTRSIESATELLVWFSADFCQLLGLPVKPEDGFGCRDCPKKFLTVTALERHKRYLHASTVGKKWQCLTCRKYFPSATKLSIHTLGHMGIKPHSCNYCNKQFTDASNLRSHLSIHTGEKRFTCSLCGKAFRQKAHLTSHFLIHSGEKKLRCRFCEHWFARSSDLRQHEYSHTHERQFPCPVCSKVFYRLQTQKKHLKVHAGQRDFECINCSKSFFTKYHMERHRKVCRATEGRPAKI